MRVVTVLRTKKMLSSDFAPKHVRALQRQVERWAPNATFTCLTDTPVQDVDCLPLQHGWPTWWAKAEIYRPDLTGDFLYLDLDTVLVGPLLTADRFTTFNSAIMFLPEIVRRRIWAAWIQDPPGHIARETKRRQWDTGLLAYAGQFPATWPAEHIAYSKLGRKPYVTAKTQAIVFSGKPRPWEMPQFRGFYE